MSDRDPRYGSNLRRRVLRLAQATLASLALATEASPSGFGDLLRQDRLTGSWSGNRPELEERGRVFFYGLGNHGGRPSENVGDLQIVSNIEAPDTWKLYEAWFEQEFL